MPNYLRPEITFIMQGFFSYFLQLVLPSLLNHQLLQLVGCGNCEEIYPFLGKVFSCECIGGRVCTNCKGSWESEITNYYSPIFLSYCFWNKTNFHFYNLTATFVICPDDFTINRHQGESSCGICRRVNQFDKRDRNMEMFLQ